MRGEQRRSCHTRKPFFDGIAASAAVASLKLQVSVACGFARLRSPSPSEKMNRNIPKHCPVTRALMLWLAMTAGAAADDDPPRRSFSAAARLMHAQDWKA